MATLRPFIAVVDDEKSVRKALNRLLCSFGMDVRTFASGGEFMEFLATRCPDCVVLDVHMDGMSGFDVQDQLKALGLPLPIVFITALENAGDRARALNAGATHFLRKPLGERILLDAVNAAVRSAGPARRPE